jgi:HEAT repeat protein
MSPRAPADRDVPARRAVWPIWLIALLGTASLAAFPAAAQTPFEQNGGAGRSRLRDRYQSPQNSQKLDENVRKLKSDDVTTRLEGLHGLGEMTDPKAIEYLMAAASDPDMRIRVKAIDTLGQVRAKEATPLLIQQLFMRDTDLGTKRRILACLGKIGDPHATSSILDFLSRDVDVAARGNAIFALGDIGDRAALPALEALTRSGQDDTLRGLAQEAIRKIRDRPEPSVVPPALAVDERRPGGGRSP